MVQLASDLHFLYTKIWHDCILSAAASLDHCNVYRLPFDIAAKRFQLGQWKLLCLFNYVWRYREHTFTAKANRSKHWQSHLLIEQAKRKSNRFYKCKESNFKLHFHIDKQQNLSAETKKYQSWDSICESPKHNIRYLVEIPYFRIFLERHNIRSVYIPNTSSGP
jgi:hypothetical protein